MLEPLHWDVLEAAADLDLPPSIFIAMYLALGICIGIEMIIEELRELS
ncbi:MAG: hypothetical protein WDN48_12925 [Pseudolabrys sp.]